MTKKILFILTMVAIHLFGFSANAIAANSTMSFVNKFALSNENSQATSKAKSYLSIMSFSRDGLIKQLEYEGFSHSAAVYGVDNCNADWFEQAVKKANSYLEIMAFSKDGLIDQLEYDGFSNEEALFGVNQIYSDTNLQAQKKAESYLKNIAFSRDGLIKQLEYEGFPHENAVAAVEIVNVDWNEQAAKKAKSYIESMSFSRDDLIRQLEFEGFTHEEAVYGAENYEIVLQNRNNLENSIVVNDSMIKVLIKNLDNLFPIKVMEDFFSNPMVATYSDVGSATAIQTSNQDGYRNIVMFTNSDSVHDYRAVTKLNAGNLQNFYLSMDIQVNDVFPGNQGGCFIGYVNEPISINGTEESVSTIGLLLSDSAVILDVKEKTADAGIQMQLDTFSTQRNQKKMTIVRLTGQTFFFVDDVFVSQYHDGKNGPFQLVYGTTVFANGETTSCSFDNLIVRKVVK
ncbi:Ltp family lipoprotein [Flexilinea flocculi]|jgi:SOS response regulatory protein OraA/RecX|uniref:Host cell surface-exposed lipoprotein n=1 Tax=Flexilinea flocculi TaxID=1678840 RepID=A0A0K8PAK9_9CHLR|nr:Ltp family lipoprotein [Flexilinea flocculi]GAP39688.1 host cell surface-exposed lipoprotein [Flexilinea flocculi]